MTQEQKNACLLGYSGLIPFFGLALMALVTGGETGAQAAQALLLYAAIICSFMGGVVWGRALAGMRDGGLVGSLVVSVIPALLAWVGVVLGGAIGALACCAGLVGLLLHDLGVSTLPAWFKRLRVHLTTGAVISTATLLL
jgi:hypothetical protein